MQQPSSLVFVAIIAGWAAYLLPQWVRRRDELAEGQVDERDSDGLRLLDRRARNGHGPSTGPLLIDLSAHDGDPVDDGDWEPGEGPGALHVAHRSLPGGPSPAALAARRRARVLVALVGSSVVLWVLAAVIPGLGGVAWVLTVLLALDVVALVVTGRQRALRRAAELEAVRKEREEERAAAERLARLAAERARVVAASRPAPPAPEPAPVAEPVAGPPAEAPVERAAERVARELSERGPQPWTPVPVPPPTYTLKATAPRPEPAPLDLPPAPAPEPVTGAQGTGDGAAPAARAPRPWDVDRTFADDLDLDAVLARRRAVNE